MTIELHRPIIPSRARERERQCCATPLRPHRGERQKNKGQKNRSVRKRQVIFPKIHFSAPDFFAFEFVRLTPRMAERSHDKTLNCDRQFAPQLYPWDRHAIRGHNSGSSLTWYFIRGIATPSVG